MGQLATTQFRIFDEARAAFVSSSLQYFKWGPRIIWDAPQLQEQGHVGFRERIGDLSLIENQTQY
jgi:hypothetical protein